MSPNCYASCCSGQMLHGASTEQQLTPEHATISLQMPLTACHPISRKNVKHRDEYKCWSCSVSRSVAACPEMRNIKPLARKSAKTTEGRPRSLSLSHITVAPSDDSLVSLACLPSCVGMLVLRPTLLGANYFDPGVGRSTQAIEQHNA